MESLSDFPKTLTLRKLSFEWRDIDSTSQTINKQMASFRVKYKSSLGKGNWLCVIQGRQKGREFQRVGKSES